MAVFRDVHFWPSVGSPDRPWLEDPGADAFVKSARRVCELYSEGLARGGLEGPSAQLRLNTHRHEDRDVVSVTVFTENVGGFEMAGVSLPDGVDLLSGESRGLLVLDVIHGAVERLAAARGWHVAAAVAARDHALEKHLQYSWHGRWKASPGRRHEARARFRLEDDGFGRVRVEVRDRTTGDRVTSSREELAVGTLAGFKRSAATLRWDTSDLVALTPYCPPTDELRADLRLSVHEVASAGVEDQAPDSVDLAAPRPRVVVIGRGPDAPEQPHEIHITGGGPTNGIPQAYLAVLGELLDSLKHDFAAWWSDSEVKLLEIYYRFDADRTTISLRKSHNRLKAFLQRPVQTVTNAPDPAALALSDVQDLVRAVAEEMRLPAPPPLRPVPARLGALAAVEDAAEAVLERRVRALVDSVRPRLPAATLEEIELNLGFHALIGAVLSVREAWAAGDIELVPEERRSLRDLEERLLG